jgi:hypothetical protein
MTKSAFQESVGRWLFHCFGPVTPMDKAERNHRFIEEALELVQAAGCSASEAHQVVDYVYSRPTGEVFQEVGGVMTSLAAFCELHGMDMHDAGEVELRRMWSNAAEIRVKQAAKPKFSPAPEAT